MVFDVSFRYKMFNRQVDGSQVQVEVSLGVVNNITAANANQAIAIASRKLGEVATDELLSVAEVTTRSF